MKRIDSINARPNVNGTGKTGFHDNADLSGQDATYLTPDFMNHLQEELCNLLEMNGVALNSNARDQLYQLLATNADIDIDALAAATQVKLDQEQTWRTDADNWLQQQINNEQTARINAINQEQAWRENADADLENRKFDKAGGTVAGGLHSWHLGGRGDSECDRARRGGSAAGYAYEHHGDRAGRADLRHAA